MSTAIAMPSRADELGQSGIEQRFLIRNVSWRSYAAIGEALRDRRSIRMTYDRGGLELMTKSLEHEEYVHLLVLLISVWTEEWNIPVKGYGSTTYQREDLDRGLEPDACFYFQNLARIRGKKRIDLTRDPVPDLVLEVEVTRSLLDRIAIYAALGVPELWRFDGAKLRVYRLDAKGRYKEQKRSPTLPHLPVQELVHFVRIGEGENETTMLRQFRAWVRERQEKR